MVRKQQVFWIGGALLYLAGLLFVPPFGRLFDPLLWTANLDGFIREWWTLGPLGTHLLPGAAALFGLLHLLIGLFARSSRSHLLLALPLLIVAPALLVLDGTLELSAGRFELLKACLFGWLASGTLAWGMVLHERLASRTIIAATLLALLYLASGWLFWPIQFLLLLVVTLYWGIDSLFSLRYEPERALLPALFWVIAALGLLAVLLLERFVPTAHPVTRLLPQISFALLLFAPSFGLLLYTSSQEGRLSQTLERERQSAKRTLAKELKRVEAGKRETVHALQLEIERLRKEVASHLAAQKTTPVVQQPLSPLEAERERSAPEPLEAAEPNVLKVDEEAVDRESLVTHMQDLAGSIHESRAKMNTLKTTLADLLGQVAIEETRVAQPFEEWEISLAGIEEQLERLRDLFALRA